MNNRARSGGFVLYKIHGTELTIIERVALSGRSTLHSEWRKAEQRHAQLEGFAMSSHTRLVAMARGSPNTIETEIDRTNTSPAGVANRKT